MKKLSVLLIELVALQLLAQPVISTPPASQIVLNGSNAMFKVAASDTGPITYQWPFNGTNLPNNIITTVAGNGTGGLSGDGGAATNAKINSTGVATDVSGNFLISDNINNRIRRVDTNGIITTIAGITGGFAGDGGPAKSANLNGPSGMAFDAFGDYFIADTGNNRIRMVDTNGNITTLAGTGSFGFSGDGGLATNATLAAPQGVAADGAATYSSLTPATTASDGSMPLASLPLLPEPVFQDFLGMAARQRMRG